MGGGLMQLVAYGAQDVYLTGNPQITFFKVVYRRHTNFAVEPIQQTWNGNADFGRTVTCTINRNGDLITHMYVCINLKETMPESADPAWGYVNRLGHIVCDNIKIEIGGSNIDEQYSDWLNIWYELTHKTGQERGYNKMIGNIPQLTDMTKRTKPNYLLYVPLQFWFNRNNGLALPLIALQYHDVRITLIFKKAIDCINWAGSNTTPPSVLPTFEDSYLLIDYVYLDSEERKRFAQASHEYLIEQLQFTGSETLSNTAKYRLNFNHPCKYLVWVPHFDKYLLRQEWVAYADDGNWTLARDRFAKILYIATRAKLSFIDNPVNLGHGVSTTDVTVIGNNPFRSNSPELWVDNTNTIYNAAAAGDLFEPVAAPSGADTAIQTLLNKISIKCIAQNDPSAGSGGISSDLTIKIAAGDIIQQILINTIILNNDLTMEDISKPLSDPIWETIKNNYPSAQALLKSATVSIINQNNYGNFIDGSDNPFQKGKLQLNGHDRFQERDGHYFNYVQPYQHFSNTPADGINVYSFALKPEDHQPTGTCNFSRIDNATLQLYLGKYNSAPSNKDSLSSSDIGNSSLLNIFTVNYNVLRVMSGMAGTAYSN